MRQNESEGLKPDPENDNRPPGNKTTFWLGVVIASLLALITVVLLNRWV
jgi:hypothetical protein